ERAYVFQAEDGIRDFHVTGVQTCALPIFNIHRQQWDEDLLKLFEIPVSMLPEVVDSASDFGVVDKELFGAAISVGGMAGDQQAALVGQACFQPGMIKSTYGTGCFMILNT